MFAPVERRKFFGIIKSLLGDLAKDGLIPKNVLAWQAKSLAKNK
jgi:hypothetical protein